jgi:hypothetical protein
MPAPKEKGTLPVATGVKFVKRANQWCAYRTYNRENVIDQIAYVPTYEDAIAKIKEWRSQD